MYTMLTSALVVLLLIAAAGFKWATNPGDQPMQRNVEPAAVPEGKGVKEPFGIYLAGETVLVGQRSVIENAPRGTLIGWARDMTTTVDDVCELQEIEGGFKTPKEAMKAYDAMKVPGSTFIRPLGRGTVAKFTFGGDRYFHIDNAKRFCR